MNLNNDYTDISDNCSTFASNLVTPLF